MRSVYHNPGLSPTCGRDWKVSWYRMASRSYGGRSRMVRYSKRFEELRLRDLFHCPIRDEPPRLAFIRWEKVSSAKAIRYRAGVPEM